MQSLWWSHILLLPGKGVLEFVDEQTVRFLVLKCRDFLSQTMLSMLCLFVVMDVDVVVVGVFGPFPIECDHKLCEDGHECL